tara:strand:+ start:1215 stop:1376 length:162 start_codon:yes stop_codon:yes gene_type:complete
MMRPAPIDDIRNAENITVFSPYLSRYIPAGIEKTPYDRKKDKGKNDARTKLKS